MATPVFEAVEWKKVRGAELGVVAKFISSAPVDLPGLCKALGVRVIASTLPPGISGEIRPDANGAFKILVNRHDPHVRQRFTVAHEVAHFLLHRELIGSGISDDVLYRSSLSSQIETEANRIAADIVMPRALVSESIRSIRGDSPADRLARLAAEFRVSEAAMAIRVGPAALQE